MTDNEKLLDILEFCKKELGNARDLQYEAMANNDLYDYYRHCGETIPYARIIDRIELLLDEGGGLNAEGETDTV